MRALFLSLALCLSPAALWADAEALSDGLAAIAAGDFEAAADAQARNSDQISRDVVLWARLRARQGQFPEYITFLDRHPDWPGLPYLRQQGEGNIPADADPATVIAYFAPQSPNRGIGVLRHAAALRALGQSADADAEVIRGWTTMTLSRDEEAAFLADHGTLLAPHHTARLDHLLWEGAETSARRLLDLVPEGWQRLAEARLALQDQRRNGINAIISAVPASLRNDPGMAFDRFVWRTRAGLRDGAVELILNSSTSAAALGRPTAWAGRRQSLARDLMRDGLFSQAYRVASSHYIDPEVDYEDYADLEWISGYVSLRLGENERALRHFTLFRNSVASPISMGRAGYWLGRAHEAMGNTAAAAEAYALGAQYQSSFYGQLAAERGGLPTDPAFLAREDYGDWRQGSYVNSTVLAAALRLFEAGEVDLSERFLTHLSESLSRREAGQLGDLALEIGSPHIALGIAKRTAQAGNEIMRAYYPMTDLAEADLPVPAALLLSIARRESEFDPTVISHAGALGLMQVMPRTGRGTAQRIGIPFNEARLLSDPAYNAVLGAGYLDHVTGEFGNNPVLISSAYNAGPSRAHAWIERFGDPRDPNVDIVDWIESVPFRETRNYIMRVTESLRIYDAQLTGALPRETLSQLLRRR